MTSKEIAPYYYIGICAHLIKKRAKSGKYIVGNTILLLALPILSACGETNSKPVSQSMVRVGQAEITVHQVNHELEHIEAPTSDAIGKVVDGLVEQQLLHNEALHNKMHRDPQVMQAIERAKAQIIVSSYLEAKVNNITGPSKEEAKLFFDKNPELFSQRKQFELVEFTMDAKDLSDKLKMAVPTANGAEDLASLLENEGVDYTSQEITRTSVDLPFSVAKQMDTMRRGQAISFRDGERLIVSFVTGIENKPLNFELARRQIESLLTNKKKEDARAAEIARLRSVTTITYLHKEYEPTRRAPIAGSDRSDGVNEELDRSTEIVSNAK